MTNALKNLELTTRTGGDILGRFPDDTNWRYIGSIKLQYVGPLSGKKARREIATKLVELWNEHVRHE